MTSRNDDRRAADSYDGEGFGHDRGGADRPRTSQAHGRHAANAIIAATSGQQTSTGRQSGDAQQAGN